MDILEISGLCKNYEKFSLKEVSFSMKEGSIMGFVGRNGAGKTTTMKAMLNFVHPDSGSVKINGLDIEKDEAAIKNSIGFVSGTDCFYNSFTVKKITSVTKSFYKTWNQDLYVRLLKDFDLDESKKIKSLSCGMKIKYQIALAMCHDARLLILDEPTSGLDPVSRDELNSIFREYISDGKHSILFSTHITSDLEKCADSITYIKNGKILDNCTLDCFKEKWSSLYKMENPALDDIMVQIEKDGTL